MESCKEFVRRIVRSLTDCRAVRSLLERIVRCLIEWRAVSSFRRIVGSLIE